MTKARNEDQSEDRVEKPVKIYYLDKKICSKESVDTYNQAIFQYEKYHKQEMTQQVMMKKY